MLFCTPFRKVNKYCLLDRGVSWLKFLFVLCFWFWFFFKFGSNEGVIFCVLNLRERTTTTNFCNFLNHVSLCSGYNLEPLGVFHLMILRLTVGKAPIGSVWSSTAKDKQISVWERFVVKLTMYVNAGLAKMTLNLIFIREVVWNTNSVWLWETSLSGLCRYSKGKTLCFLSVVTYF